MMSRSGQSSFSDKIKECEVGQEYWVDVTHVNNPHSFFVRLIDRRIDFEALEERGNPVEDSEVTIGRVIIYLSMTLNKFVRGQVFFIHWHNVVKCDVKAIDYGCHDYDVPTSKIYKPRNLITMLPLAIHCKLANCAPTPSDSGEIWNSSSTEAMVTYIGKEKTKMIVRNKIHNQLSVDLINSCPDDIATMLALTHFSVLGCGNETSVSRTKAPEPQLVNPRFTTISLQINEVQRVRIQSGTNLNRFFVAKTQDFRKHLLEYNDFTSYCRHQRVITEKELEVGNLVAYRSLSGTSYERAVILEIIEPKYKVLLQKIDWGDCVTAAITEIKPITCEMYLNKPALAIFCSTDKELVWDNGLQKFLYPGFELMIRIKNLGDGFNKPNVVNVFPLKK